MCSPSQTPRVASFAHVDQYTAYSLLDGVARIKGVIKWVKEATTTTPTCRGSAADEAGQRRGQRRGQPGGKGGVPKYKK